MKTIRILATGLMMMALFVAPATAQKKNVDITKHPGYVDFRALADLEDEAKIEVNLREPMLKLAIKFLENEDPELADALSELKLIRVHVYDLNPKLTDKILKFQSDTAKKLNSAGWERIVKIRDGDESVMVYLRPDDDYEMIQGIVVMVISADDEAVFVNVVGNIKPEDIHRLGKHFDIDELGDIDYESLNKHGDG